MTTIFSPDGELNHLICNQKILRCSLVNTLKEVKPGYGEDRHALQDEYLKVLRERYFKAKIKKEKSQILDEYCRNPGQSRKRCTMARLELLL